MDRKTPALTQTQLQDRLDYDPATGIFVWKIATGSAKVGQTAGYKRKDGYRELTVCGQLFYAHRLAWFYVTGSWPPEQIDHINLIEDDNRFENLRLASRAQNYGNTSKKATNKSGFKGVSWSKVGKRWQAFIAKDGRSVGLGYFDTREEAHAAYCAAAVQFFGEFAHF